MAQHLGSRSERANKCRRFTLTQPRIDRFQVFLGHANMQRQARFCKIVTSLGHNAYHAGPTVSGGDGCSKLGAAGSEHMAMRVSRRQHSGHAFACHHGVHQRDLVGEAAAVQRQRPRSGAHGERAAWHGLLAQQRMQLVGAHLTSRASQSLGNEMRAQCGASCMGMALMESGPLGMGFSPNRACSLWAPS